ncbi:unnamed protein product [Gordionus sp. m RMFG-2023]|uniref:uncharacterized protein LOC135931149 n=1 Tax=Gordionus sp. m RMFG-2023 TaxID=3053472 RepID=UPI0030E26564
MTSFKPRKYANELDSFDENLIKKLSQEKGQVESYMDFITKEDILIPKVENDNVIKDIPNIEIILKIVDGKHNKNWQETESQEEKKLLLQKIKEKLRIQKKLALLEKIHKAHLLTVLAHAHYINTRICNDTAFRGAMLALLADTKNTENSIYKEKIVPIPGIKLEPKPKIRMTTRKSKEVETAKNNHKKAIEKEETKPTIYSSFKDKIDVPSLIKWIQRTFTRPSFDILQNTNAKFPYKDIRSLMMLSVYRKIDPDFLISFNRQNAENIFRKSSTESSNSRREFTADPCGYLNIIAVILLRTLGIPARLIINIKPSSLKLPQSNVSQKDKSESKKSPQNKPNAQQSSHHNIQYWLEVEIEESRKKSANSSKKIAKTNANLNKSQGDDIIDDTNNFRWQVINCVLDLNNSSPQKDVKMGGGRSKIANIASLSTPPFLGKNLSDPHYRETQSKYFTDAGFKGAGNVFDTKNLPEGKLNSLGIPKPISYVIGLNEENIILDLTLKYSHDWHFNGRKFRISSKSPHKHWWDKTLSKLNHLSFQRLTLSKNKDTFAEKLVSLAKVCEKPRKRFAKNEGKGGKENIQSVSDKMPIVISKKRKSLAVINKEVGQEILSIAKDRPLPTSINAFKDHPLYVLKRHLLRHQAIYPPDAPPIAFIRNEAVYSRELHLKTLKARINWLKDDARLIKKGEVGYKLVLKRPSFKEIMMKRRLRLKGLALIKEGSEQNEDDGDSKSNSMLIEVKNKEELFGIWQTEEYIPLPLVDGQIPKNSYGNVELFQMSMLPLGCVYLSGFPGLNKVAQTLKLQCVPAMRGWEFSGGHAFPIIDGWVLIDGDQQRLMDEWDRYQVKKESEQIQKKEKTALNNWKKFIKALIIRRNVENRYGNISEPVDSDEIQSYPLSSSQLLPSTILDLNSYNKKFF